MHLFRWTRFLSWKRYRPSSPRTRRSSRWLLRHFTRSGSSRASLEAPGLSAGSSFDMRPSLIYIDEFSTVNDRASREEEDRLFIEECHQLATSSGPTSHTNGPLSPRRSSSSNASIVRVNSLFNTTGRSTIRDRASIINLFNQLQFEMPPPPPPQDPAPPDVLRHGAALENPTSPESGAKKKMTRSQKRLAKRKLKRMRSRGVSMASATSESSLPVDSRSETESLLASTEPSFFRQYMQRAKRKSVDEESKLRPLTTAQCRAYLQSVALDPPTIGSRRDLESSPDSPPSEPMEFLFFGGCTEANPHGLCEVDAEPRRYRARFVASQPTSSSTTSIPIKPTLVRGLPPVFEPRFESMYI